MKFVNLKNFGFDFYVNCDNVIFVSNIQESNTNEGIVFGVKVLTNGMVSVPINQEEAKKVDGKTKNIPFVLEYRHAEKSNVKNFVSVITNIAGEI